VEYTARPIGVNGWVRNLDEGHVEVYAIGNAEQLSALEGYLWQGPRFSDVRGVTTAEDTIDSGVRGFQIRY
jgi:acylphosphatase